MSGGRRLFPAIARMANWVQYNVMGQTPPPPIATPISATPRLSSPLKGITKFKAGSGAPVAHHLAEESPLTELVESETKSPDSVAEFQLQTPIAYLFTGAPNELAFEINKLTVTVFQAASGDAPHFFRLSAHVLTDAGYHITTTPRPFSLKLAFLSAPSATPTVTSSITFRVWDEPHCQNMESEQVSDHLPRGLLAKSISGIQLLLPRAIKLQRAPHLPAETEEENIQTATPWWESTEATDKRVYDPTCIPGAVEVLKNP